MSYRVVKIVDEYLIVVNYGADDGAKVGDLLQVFKEGEEVYDPVTEERLGTLDIDKGCIKVVNTYEYMSLCKSATYYRKVSSAVNSFNSTLASISNALGSTEVQPLNVNTKQISGGYSKGGLISLGDPVKLLKKSTFENDDE
jgi:hypothetical protein